MKKTIFIISLNIIVALFVGYILYINTPTKIGNTGFSLQWYDLTPQSIRVLCNTQDNITKVVLIEHCDEVWWNDDYLLFNTWNMETADTLSYYIVHNFGTGYSIDMFSNSSDYNHEIQKLKIDKRSLSKTSFIRIYRYLGRKR